MRDLAVSETVPQEATWQENLLLELRRFLQSEPSGELFTRAIEGGCGIHLAILVEPYLTLILEGKKTIESRFSLNRQTPYERVNRDDILILKRSSGAIEGICRVVDAWFYHLEAGSWDEIEKFAAALCMDESPFWQGKRKSTYGSLIRIAEVLRTPPWNVSKLDPRGWVTLRKKQVFPQGDLF